METGKKKQNKLTADQTGLHYFTHVKIFVATKFLSKKCFRIVKEQTHDTIFYTDFTVNTTLIIENMYIHSNIQRSLAY